MKPSPDDQSPLSDAELQALTNVLAQRESTLRGEVRDVDAADDADREGFAGIAPDLVDVAEHRRGEDMRHAERERDELELVEIAAARQRMAEGHYGVCTDCSEPIARARLNAQPWASRCIDCQALHERLHGHTVPTVATGADNH